MKIKFIKSMLFSTIGLLSTSVVTPIVLSSCGKKKQKTIPVTSVSLDNDRLDLIEGETAQLTATVLPENATNKNVAWNSSDESIATVDQNGNIKAISEGNTTITVITEDGKRIATCEVDVTNKTIPVTGVTLDRDKLELVEGRVAKLVASILPTNATNKNVTWSSLKSSVATVDQSGFVTAKAPGNVEIAVTTEDGWHTTTCKVTVTEKVVPVTGVTLDKDKLELIEDDVAQLKATVLPEDATNKNVTWGTSAPSVATVDKNGNVKALSEGTATISIVTEYGGYTATCEVNVAKRIFPVTGVKLDKNSLELNEGQVAQLIANIIPENATNKNVTWSSSDESVATVDENGNVEAIGSSPNGPTFATITVTTEDGEYTDSCTVSVNPPVVVGMNYDFWGDITVKYKLYSNHECRLLTKFNGEDSENGYVSGKGTLIIPDHVIYNDTTFYVRKIPSEWSDGSNNIDGIEFEYDVSHLKEICDYAFKNTDALNNYDHKVCIFPEGLEYIGTEAFYNVDRGNELVMAGLDFPSTLNAINVRAFANAGLIGDEGNPATIMFRGNFNTANMANEAFSSIRGKNVVYFVYAPVMEIAANIANHIRVVYENDFETGEGYLIPKELS